MGADRELLVQMKIPIEPPMGFRNWLPLSHDDEIAVAKETMTARFWFDLTCTWTMGDLDESTLAKWGNVGADKVLVDVEISDLREELIEWILTRSPSGRLTPEEERRSEEHHLQEDYESLAEKVYTFVLSYFNRLIAYTRTQKGQFWLQEYPISTNKMKSDFTKFRARVRAGETEWSRWCSSDKPVMLTVGPMHLDRYWEENTWTEAKEFVSSSSRTQLTWELLAGAELLANSGHTHGALTEAITALEVEAHQFGRDVRANETFGPILAERLDLHSLKTQIEHMGVSGTIRYLLPVIFTEEQMPAELLSTCQDAIDQRGNVVHQGQRTVDEEKLSHFLSAIRDICSILGRYQGATQ